MTSMANERDCRTLAPATQAELRRLAVAMVRAGKTRTEAAEAVGVHRRLSVGGSRRRRNMARQRWRAGVGVVVRASRKR